MLRPGARTWIAAAAIALACGGGADRQVEEVPAGEGVFSGVDGRPWVRIYDPEHAADGYTLAFYRRRIPVLIDMNGRIVHSWPEARVKSRLRLLPDGSLLGISLAREVVEYDWDGNLVWQFKEPRRLPHHDVIRLANGNTMVLALRRPGAIDELLEVDRDGRIVWEWDSSVHLAEYLAKRPRRRKEATHINSVQELPENPYATAGDDRFRPGNLLISARNLSTLFVLDRETGAVVWSYRGRLDYQHEGYMIPPGMPGHGRILVFDNRYHDTSEIPGSRVIEIDPVTSETTWSYEAPGFFSSTGGLQQPLANGNVLIASSRGGRAFEVTREGEIVWSWSPPFDPNRPQRYPVDHAPQLAALPREAPSAVRPPTGYRHIDRGVHRFGVKGHRVALQIGRKRRYVLRDGDLCRAVMLPEQAVVEVGYGVDRRAARRLGRGGYEARFSLRMFLAGSTNGIDVFADTVGLDGDSWRHRTLGLAEHSYSKVRLCVGTEETDGLESGRRLAHWNPPSIRSANAPELATDDPIDELTAEELEARRQHLETLGYVD